MLKWANPTTSGLGLAERLSLEDLRRVSAWGQLDYAEITADSANVGVTITNVITGHSVDIPAKRRIKITLQAGVQTDTDNTTGKLYIREGATTLQTSTFNVPLAIIPMGAGTISYVFTPTAGAHTYVASINRTSGAGNVAIDASVTQPAFILVEDMGPSE